MLLCFFSSLSTEACACNCLNDWLCVWLFFVQRALLLDLEENEVNEDEEDEAMQEA